MIDYSKPFGTIIREQREEKRKQDPDFSLRKFAAAVELSPTFLSKIENNEFAPPRAEKVIRMAELLDLDASLLLSRANKIAPELKRIVIEHQSELITFLRTVDGKSSQQIKEMTDAAQHIADGHSQRSRNETYPPPAQETP